MAAIVRASCPVHGDLAATSDEVSLRICTNRPSLSTYTVPCPRCGTVTKPADIDAIELLEPAGVRITRWSVPAEALERHDGPPLTDDDLIDFALALKSEPDIIAEARA